MCPISKSDRGWGERSRLIWWPWLPEWSVKMWFHVSWLTLKSLVDGAVGPFTNRAASGSVLSTCVASYCSERGYLTWPRRYICWDLWYMSSQRLVPSDKFKSSAPTVSPTLAKFQFGISVYCQSAAAASLHINSTYTNCDDIRCIDDWL